MAPTFKDDLDARIQAIEGATISSMDDLRALAAVENPKLVVMRNRLWQDQRENPPPYSEFDQDKDKLDMAKYIVAMARRWFGPRLKNSDHTDTSWSVVLWDERDDWPLFHEQSPTNVRDFLVATLMELAKFLRAGVAAINDPTAKENCFNNARISPFPPIGGG